MMRAIALITITWLGASGLFAQSYYKLFGPQVIDDPCVFYAYIIETDSQLYQTEWYIIPSNGTILGGFLYDILIQFPGPGTYILVATSTTYIGDTLSDTLKIEVYGQSFTPEVIGCYEINQNTTCYQVCSKSKTIINSFNGVEYEVSGAQGYQLISSTSIEVTWGNAGIGYVFVNYQGLCGIRLCFEILAEPVADFTTLPATVNDTIAICQNQEIQFANQSLNALIYLWDFGDGEKSQGKNAAHAFNVAGFYTVTLNAESICSCTAQEQVVVEVLPTPAPTLDCVNSVCAETRQRYTATTNGCNIYHWSVSANGTVINGGGINDDFIEIIWHEGPEGLIELLVDNCASQYCVFSNTFQIPIITNDGPISGDVVVCSGEITSYEVPYFPGTQYQWQVGSFGSIISGENTNAITIKWKDGNISSTTFVSVEYENCFLECGGEDVMSISISPAFYLSGDSQVCQNSEASAQASSQFGPSAQVNWHLENELGQIVYTQPGLSDVFTHTFSYPSGNYEWVATNSSSTYCNAEVRLPIQVTALPPAPLDILGENEICTGVPYGFTIDPAGNYATVWTITDGSNIYTYQGQTFQHIFGPTPPYIVEAVHADIQFSNCTSDPVLITLHTIADFSISGPAEVCFNDIDLFSFPFNSGANYDWEIIPNDHGEIKRTALNNVEVFWTQSGPVTLRLNACGLVFEKIIEVHPLPEFNLAGSMAVCANEFVSISTDHPLLSHSWSDANQNLIGLSNAISLSAGSYSVTAKDVFGCQNKKPFEISSFPIPSIHISTAFPNVYCNSIPPGVSIVSNTDGTYYLFTWYKNDVSMGSGAATLLITDFGTYHAEVTNQYGCKSISDEISFLNCCIPADCNSAPACFNVGCTYLPQDFDIVTSGADCQSRQYTPLWPGIIPDQSRWSILSLSQGTLAIIEDDILSYAYAYPGYYVITMTGLINGFPYLPGICGHFQELRDTIRAIAEFDYHGQCAGDMIKFEDLTTFLPDESISSWSWNFGDPSSGVDNISSLQDPTHIFSAAGEYDVRLTSMMVSGCTVTKIKRIHISSGPVLLPSYDPVYCKDEALAFHLPSDVFDIAWDFGDATSGVENMSASDSPFHTYALSGLYTTIISAADIYSCRSETTFGIDIHPNTLTGLIDVAPAGILCFGDTATLTSPPIGESWLWSTGQTVSQIKAAESNQYSLWIEDEFHCTYSPPPVFVAITPKPDVFIQVREISGPDLFGSWQNELHICQGTEFEIQGFSSTANADYYWTHGSTDSILQFTDEGGNLPVSGLYTYSLIIIDPLSGCISDTASIVVEIYANPQQPLIALSGGSGCSFDVNTLAVTNPESGVEYHWSDGQIGSSITTDNAGTYFVTAVNLNGCSNESETLMIKSAAPIDQIPGGCHIACDPLPVCLPPIDNVTSWSIFQNGILYQSGTTWPSDYLITSDGSYTIEVTTLNGCTATSDPLDISLYTGVGSITVLVYEDVDSDGVISAADLLLSGIPVQIESADGLQHGETYTEGNGSFVFEDYPASAYTASFNLSLLSSQWKVVIDSVLAQILTCDDSIVVSLLLMENCIVTGPNQTIESCPRELVMYGDSIWSDTGLYIVHLLSALGCDSTFEVNIVLSDTIEIGATVWVDVDQNGILSPADTVIQGITIVIDEGINHAPFIALTDINGNVLGEFTPGNYFVSVDSTILPPGLSLLYGLDFVSDTICGAVTFDFLLTTSCADVFIIQQEEICSGDSVLIEGQWITDAGLYSFLLSQAGSGCDTTLDVYVTLLPEPVIASLIEWDCIHLGSIEFTVEGTSPFQYYWSPSVQGDSIVSGLIDGMYNVTILDFNGCTASVTFTILGSPPLTFELQNQYEILAGDSILIVIMGDTSLPGLDFQWSPTGFISCDTCAQTWAFPDSTSILTVQITDTDSCVYTFETSIVVTYDSSTFDQIYVPNIFSPNGDGINDRWTIYSRLNTTYVHSLTLFDRWGKMLFYKEEFLLNSFEGWDGVSRGKNLSPNVFVYVAELTLGDGTKRRVKGDVTLVR